MTIERGIIFMQQHNKSFNCDTMLYFKLLNIAMKNLMKEESRLT